METIVTDMRWNMDGDGTWVSFLVQSGYEARKFVEENKGSKQKLKISRFSEKRSLSANAYAWTLINKLSEKLHISPDKIYRQMIPDVGGNTIATSIKLGAVDELRRTWGANGIGWIVDLIGVSDVPGYVDVLMYYGSSVYDRTQMARLIDLIIEECKEQGVEYLPPDKLESMLDRWEANEKK